MGLLDDASDALDEADALAARQERDFGAARAREEEEGALLIAEFIERASALGIEPQIELRDAVHYEESRYQWEVSARYGGWSLNYVHGTHKKTCESDEVVGLAWDIRPETGWDAFLISPQGHAIEYLTEVLEETNRHLIYPDPVPQKFVKRWRVHPVGLAVRPATQLSCYDGDSTWTMPIAEGMARFLRRPAQP